LNEIVDLEFLGTGGEATLNSYMPGVFPLLRPFSFLIGCNASKSLNIKSQTLDAYPDTYVFVSNLIGPKLKAATVARR
jgi:hypothetical protein